MIAASDISMRFGQQTLFENVSVKFTPGSRYGLIGANGSGKSTFMKILSGQQQPTTGTVSIDKDCRMGFLKQNHYDYEDVPILDVVYMGNEELWKIHQEREYLYSKVDLTPEEEDRANDIEGLFADAGGYTMEADAAKLLVGLGIPEEKHTQPLSSLTGGFKLRVLLAQVLFYNPDILLLDEPTNHLDMGSIDWLCNLLKNHKGTVIVISHNRYFLNEVCTNIADLDYQEIRLFTGNYDDFMTANEIALEKMRRENARKESRISELKEFINRFGANASKARQATSRQKELDKIQLEEIKPSSRVSPFIRFTPQTRLGEKVIDKTSFDVPTPVSQHQSSGRVRIDGMVRGEIRGQIHGIVHAYVDGDVNISLLSGQTEPDPGEDTDPAPSPEPEAEPKPEPGEEAAPQDEQPQEKEAEAHEE